VIRYELQRSNQTLQGFPERLRFATLEPLNAADTHATPISQPFLGKAGLEPVPTKGLSKTSRLLTIHDPGLTLSVPGR
jgi:hypothetical protein